jgi:hypothetical protein
MSIDFFGLISFMKIPEQMLLLSLCGAHLVWQTTSIPALCQSVLASDTSRSSLLAQSSANTYTPGQPIKLHDYGTSTYGKPSAAPFQSPAASTTPSTPYQSPAASTTAHISRRLQAPHHQHILQQMPPLLPRL